MENTSTKSINDFINGFGLKDPAGLTIFKAGIVVRKDGSATTAESDVHIITSNDLMTVYLMDDIVDELDIPEMYRGTEHVFSFIPWQCLQINVQQHESQLIIEIFPKR